MPWPSIDPFEEKVPAEGSYPEWHAVYTIQLGELIQTGFFNWGMVEWSGIGEHTDAIKRAFEMRYRFAEISMLPPQEWLTMLSYKLEYELTPKYAPIFADLGDGSYLRDEGEYTKYRNISSTYPETLLDNTGEAYASSGIDFEQERIKTGSITDKLNSAKKVNSVIGLFLDELEPLFIGLYTTHVNGY